MVLTDEAAFILMLFLGGFLLLVVAVAVAGLVFAAKGKRAVGVALILGIAAFVFGPNLVDQARSLPIRADLAARVSIPETLNLSGQRVLFIDSGSTICGGLCSDVLGVGTDVEAYWIDAGGTIAEGGADHPLLGVLGREQDVVRVHLGAPVADLGGQRYAEVVSDGGLPPYDVVIFQDESGLLSYAAPDLLGPPLPADTNLQFATLVFTDWADPFVQPPPEPTYRSVSAWIDMRPILWWPFRRDSDTHPSLIENRAAWARAICAGAGPQEARDAFTYGYRCAPETGIAAQ